MIKGFKEFILRGNVIDLAVAVVIGTAFTNIVNTIVMGILNPAIGALFSTASLAKSLPVTVPPILHGGIPATIYFGALIGAIIQFVLVAVLVYFALVVPINYVKNRAAERKAKGMPPADAPITELDLLTDIRDLLANGAEPVSK
ncbi:MAG TPA: large conductance mechanosensitive channel protein MscL [Galbitalea sp.]|jgi:large conductance mechanosensitive channel|nr:large conductance mechanosensitive channel protein MscL [Galbitalea sp.]